MAAFFKWVCDGCKRSFVRPSGEVIELKCRWCGQEDKGFSKIGEQETKYT